VDILTNGLEGGGFLKGDRNGRGSVFQNAGLESFKKKKKGRRNNEKDNCDDWNHFGFVAHYSIYLLRSSNRCLLPKK
jgi:hypothetical protein